MTATKKVKVDDRVWRELRKRLNELGKEGAHVKVGVLASSGTHGDSDITMVELAAVHEFGSPAANIPERSFIRSTLEERRDEMVAMLGRFAKGIVAGKESPDAALDKLGLWASSAIKKKITGEDIPPPLKPATVAAKGSSKPLVDTGQLLNSISWEKVTS